MTEPELENQRALVECAACWGANQVIERAAHLTAQTADTLFRAGERHGEFRGFWYGFAAGAAGAILSMGITWLMFR